MWQLRMPLICIYILYNYIYIIIFICNTWVLNHVGRNHKEDMVPAGIWSAREVASLHGNKKMFLWGFWDSLTILVWLVVWNIFYFSIYWEQYSHLTNIFQRGWNHRPVVLCLTSFALDQNGDTVDQSPVNGIASVQGFTHKYSPNSVTLMNSIFCDWSHPSPSCRISIYSLYKYCPCIPNIFFGGTQGCLISEFSHPSARPRTWWWPQSTSLWKPRRGAAVPTKARRSCGF